MLVTTIGSPRKSQGLTMVEMLVVTVLIAILSAAVVLTVDFGSDAKKIRKIAETLHNQLLLAQDESLFSGDLIGVEVFENGYRFVQWYTPQGFQGNVTEITDASGAEGVSPDDLGDGVVLEGSEVEAPPLEAGYWEPVSGDPMRTTFWLPEAFKFVLEVEASQITLPELLEEEQETEALAQLDFQNPEQNPFQPAIFFLPTAETTEFKLTLYVEDNAELDYVITSDLMGRIQLVRPGEPTEEVY